LFHDSSIGIKGQQASANQKKSYQLLQPITVLFNSCR
jgi:hypothetical protein